MRAYHWLAVLALVFLFGHAFAQQQPTEPSHQRAKLDFLVGSFTTETNMPPQPMAPKGATGKGTSVIHWALDSMFLMIDEQGLNSVLGQYKGHGMLGFDPHTGQYQLFMFSNYGDHPSYQGIFTADTLTLMTHVPMPGRPFDQKLLWYKAGSTVKLRVLNDAGKGFDLVVEQTATPVPQPPR